MTARPSPLPARPYPRVHPRLAHPKRVLHNRIRLQIAMIRALRAVLARGIFIPPGSAEERKKDLAEWQAKLRACLAKYRATKWRTPCRKT